MAKKQAQPEVENMESVEQDDNVLENFVKHQRNAAVEAGRALASLIPRGLREHGFKAIEESAKGFGLVVEAVADGVGDVVRTVKDEIILPKDDQKKEE